MRLQTGGWARKFYRSLHTVRGVLLALVGLAVIGFWIWGTMLTPREAAAVDAEGLRRSGPAFFLAYCVLTVLLSRGDRAIYFSPAEVNFLFTGPYTRRELLIYKILASVLIGLPTTLFMTVLLRIHANWFLAAYIGLFLAFLFMQLFTMAVSLIAISIGTKAYTHGRKILIALIVLAAAVVLFRASQKGGGGGFAGIFQQVQDTPVWKVLTAPLSCYIEVFLTPKGDWSTLLYWTGLSSGFTVVLVMIVLLLDAQFLETAAATSERLYSQIQKIRRGEAVTISWSDPGKARWGLPSFPFWGGVGPIAWRQTTTALRSLGRLAIVVLILAPVMIGPMFTGDRRRSSFEEFTFVAGMLAWLSMLLTTLVPFDFRGDLDRMEVLKTLPIPAWRVVVGQLIAPILILGTLQLICLVSFVAAMDLGNRLLVWGVLFLLPLNFLLFGLDNLLFLWFPSRIFATNPGDFQALGRNVLILLVKMVVMVGAGLLGGAAGWLVWYLTGGQLDAALLAGWIILVMFAAILVPLAAIAFRNFDVSRDMPA
jgi:hypothetical protein